MKYSFDSDKSTIIVQIVVLGTGKEAIFRLCLDAGAERTILSEKAVRRIRMSPPENAEKSSLLSASGEVQAPFVVLPKFFALGTLKESFPVYVHTLPYGSGIDGLLGLDFMRGHVLNIDFKTGEIAFE